MKKNRGFYWHVHHNVLAEWCYDYKRRVLYIRNHKPQAQIGERLRLFQPIKGRLPIPLIRAHHAVDSASDELGWKAYRTIRDRCGRMLKECAPQINALHKKECPNCPWNGKELIFH